jgi:hypothetical protein
MERDQLRTILPGDIACVHATGAMFRVDEETAADPETQERAARFEISPTGPLWGAEMMTAGGRAGADELEELEREGVTETDLVELARTLGDAVAGARRPLRVPVGSPEVEGGADEHGNFIRLAFELPAGSFATSLLREVMKTFPLECTHIARRGGHPIFGRDPQVPPAGRTRSTPLARIDTNATIDDAHVTIDNPVGNRSEDSHEHAGGAGTGSQATSG